MHIKVTNSPNFCIHIQSDLSQIQADRFFLSLDRQTIGSWTICDKTTNCEREGGFCLLVSAPVTLEPKYFETIAQAYIDSGKDILTTDFAWKSNFEIEDLVQIKIPNWSSYRFNSVDYIGSVVAIARFELFAKKPLAISRKFLNEVLIHKEVDLLNLRYQGYLQYGPNSGLSNSERIDILEKSDSYGHLKFQEINPNLIDVQFRNRIPKSISVIIPTRGSYNKEANEPCIYEAIRSTTKQKLDGAKLEFVIIFDSQGELSYLDEVKKLTKGFPTTFVEYTEKFNFSKKCNIGANAAQGEVLIFLNDDTFWLSDWGLAEMCGIAMQNDVGAVGAKLYFPSGQIQHAGIVTRDGNAGHAYFKSKEETGPFGDLRVTHEVMGVTGACLAQRKSVWENSGGWDELFANSYNDVDYTFRLRNKGFNILVANSVELVHFESLTRVAYVSDYEFAMIRARWHLDLTEDQFMYHQIESHENDPSKIKSYLDRFRQAKAIYKNYGFRELILRIRRYMK